MKTIYIGDYNACICSRIYWHNIYHGCFIKIINKLPMITLKIDSIVI